MAAVRHTRLSFLLVSLFPAPAAASASANSSTTSARSMRTSASQTRYSSSSRSRTRGGDGERQALLGSSNSSEACSSNGNGVALVESAHYGTLSLVAGELVDEGNPFVTRAETLPLEEEGCKQEQAHEHFHHHHESVYGNLKLLAGFVLGIFATLACVQALGHLRTTHGSAEVAAASLTVSSTQASPVKTSGRTVELNGIHYYLPGKPRTTFALKKTPSAWSQYSLIPLTVVASDAQTFGEVHLDGVHTAYSATDDVWQPAFMQNVFLQYNGSASYAFVDASASSSAAFLLKGYSASRSAKAIDVSAINTIPAGPYFAALDGKKVSIFEAWRLYSDNERAFLQGLVPHDENEDSMQVLASVLPDSNGQAAIAVPSRLYYTKTADKPLAGVRVSVKDLYDIKGLKTSMSSRAWLSLYPAATSNAPAIQRLLNLGAVIVGKTRFSQFANGEYGTADSVDFSVPFNVRGDGYQDPSSSSSGAGAAAGAYGFIDLHLGSDTGGSVRAPAGVNGAFGNRPSQGAMDLSGALPLSPAMDTAALLGLDAKVFAEHCKLFYGGNSTFRSARTFPKKLLYLIDPSPQAGMPSPGFFPVQNPDAAAIFENFVRLLEAFLGTRREKVDFYAEFRKRFGISPPDYLGRIYSSLTAYEQYHLIGKQFDAAYASANDGDRPFIDPPVRANWDRATQITEDIYQDFLHRKQEFAVFIREALMDSTSASSCSNALTVFPLMTGRPSYKSDYHLDTPAYIGFNRFGIAQLGQVPEIVIPIGEVPYFSKITQTTKYLPVSISIQAAHGCDFVLYDLLIALADAGIVRNPTAGTARTFT